MARFDVSEIEDAESAAKEESMVAEETKRELLAAIAFLERASFASRDAKARIATRVAEARIFLKNCREHKIPTVRRAVWKALLEHELNKPAATPVEVNSILSSMVSQGLLEEMKNGEIGVYGKTYAVPSASLLDEQDTTYIRDLVSRLVARVRREVKERVDIEPSDLPDSKEGTCLLYVPAERVNGDPKEWRPGGTLSLEVKRGFISPIDAHGRFEPAVRRAIELGVVVECGSLTNEGPPFLKGVEFEKAKKVQLVWHLIVRGLRFAEWLRSAREAATCTPEEFYLQGATGSCLVDIGEAWRWEEANEVNWIPRPVLLVERKVVGEDKIIKVLDLPAYLVDFLSGSDEHPEGERFSGLPLRLGAIMRAAYRNVREGSKKRAQFAG